MNRLLTIAFFTLLATSLFSVSVYANNHINPSGLPAGSSQVNPSGTPTTNSLTTLRNPLKVGSLGEAVNTGIEIFSYIVVLAAVIMLVWVGLQFILARGRPERLKELKSWLLWIVVGVAIVLGARIMIQIIIATLQATGAVNPQVINSAQNALGN